MMEITNQPVDCLALVAEHTPEYPLWVYWEDNGFKWGCEVDNRVYAVPLGRYRFIIGVDQCAVRRITALMLTCKAMAAAVCGVRDDIIALERMCADQVAALPVEIQRSLRIDRTFTNRDYALCKMERLDAKRAASQASRLATC